MNDEVDLSQGKSVGDLGHEALWLILHTLIAIAIFAVVIGIMTLFQPNPDSSSPKLLATLLCFLVPMIGGYIVARIRKDVVASWVWLSALFLFAVVCVWVLDLPTGIGLCEKCGPVRKLTRTFFEFNNGSGLMGGDGVLVGTWLPLSIIAYSLGARFALRPNN
ncbi:hypothetical protein [Granulicella sibirica]|uniref:Uncharacterized protein n=1 Tax=Granulicella sibirica TaxID=2479048 RepID=A0A4V1L5R1_9BACT|nr:hypothetical protein [Granulicella sibirica]RXH56644.1 hypothetical protein GRAN_3501 [Granulicella sibirica]